MELSEQVKSGAPPAPAVVPQESPLPSESPLIRVAMGLLILALVIHLLQLFATVLQQLFIAAFLAYVILPAHRWLVRHGIGPTFSFLVIILVFFAASFGLGQMTYSSAEDLHAKIPLYEQNLRNMGKTVARDLLGVEADPVGDLLRAEPSAADHAGSQLRSLLGTFFGYLGQAFVVLIYLAFLLAERGGLARRVVEGYGARAPRIMGVTDRINASIEQYIAVKAWMSVLAGVLTTIVLLLFGVDYAALWGVITFAFNFIPYLGSMIAVVLPVLLSLVQYENLWYTLALLAVLLVIQNGIGYYIEPRMAGARLDLSPLVIILSLAFWGSLWGIVGMILAVPLVVVIKTILENIPQTRPLAMLLSNR
ncbi:MAG: AI-2E family transporter [Gemmataceae bacterium]|nr:AI-2E family transporter [Gemmataceae bacterium]